MGSHVSGTRSRGALFFLGRIWGTLKREALLNPLLAL